MATPIYHIYGLSNPTDYSLYIDYMVQDDVEKHKEELLQKLQQASSIEPVFQQWLKTLQPYNVFEIECVDQYEATQEAVEFWRNYFHACGETIINTRHFIDRLK